MKHLKKIASAAALAMAASFTAHATITDITQNNQWYAFDIDDQTAFSGTTEWIDLAANIGDPLSFSFSVATPTLLRIIDAGFSGDRFNIHLFDGSSTLTLQTGNAVDSFPSSVFNDYDAAWADPSYSHLSRLLNPGTYTLSGDLFTAAGGGAPLNVTTGAVMLAPVPEPSEWLMLVAGIGLVAGWARRRSPQ